MRTEPAAKRTMPNLSLAPLKRPFDGVMEQVRQIWVLGKLHRFNFSLWECMTVPDIWIWLLPWKIWLW